MPASLLIPLPALLLAGSARAATLEVAPGDDIPTLLASLTPGSEIVFGNGTYDVSVTLSVSVAGTESAPVLLRAKNNGEAVFRIAAAEDGSYPSRIFDVSESSFVTLRGLVFEGDDTWRDEEAGFGGLRVNASTDVLLEKVEVREMAGTALNVAGDNSRVTIRRTHVHDVRAGHGIVVGCYDASCWTNELVLFNNWVHDIGSADRNCVTLHHGTQGALVTDNVVYTCDGAGVFLGSTENGDANTFEGNAVWSTNRAGVWVEGPATLRNNIVFNVDGRGILARDPGRETGAFGDLVLSFNTVADTTGWAVELNDWETAAGELVFANNALCNPIGQGVEVELEGDDTALPVAPGVVSSNVVCGNVVGLDEFRGEVVPGDGFSDFTDAAGWDFYPTDGATIWNSADPSGSTYVPEVDFNGVARPGDAPDVGAYERQGATNPGWAVKEGFKEFDLTYDNPQEFVGGCCDDQNNEAAGGKGAQAALIVPLLGLGVGLRRRRRG